MQGTIPEYMAVIQTAIMFLTGLVILWYTWETKKIREETHLQNMLLLEQMELMRESRNDELARQMSFIKPFFIFGIRTVVGKVAEYEFTNKGGPAKTLSAKLLGDFRVSVSPQHFVGTNGKGMITVITNKSDLGSKYPFEMSCIDRLNKTHVFKFYYQPGKGFFEADPPQSPLP